MCRTSKTTSSGLVCCPLRADCGIEHRLTCPATFFECSAEMGGGCCRRGQHCSITSCDEYSRQAHHDHPTQPTTQPSTDVPTPVNLTAVPMRTVQAGSPITGPAYPTCLNKTCHGGQPGTLVEQLPLSQRMLGTQVASFPKMGNVARIASSGGHQMHPLKVLEVWMAPRYTASGLLGLVFALLVL